MWFFSSGSSSSEHEALAAINTKTHIMPSESSSERGDRIAVTEAGDHEKGRHGRVHARPNKASRLKLKRFVNSAVVFTESSLESLGICDQSSVRARYLQMILRSRSREQQHS
eukprot:NODE_22988_length_685_cov_4.519713.p1 GENE.NODE_22988_length_685_cov_4.519713~~NODE_22988_length_685_cov_4.519713.p1  ORF type:complete len:130 (+),score=19.33 NODE_22988_length_685_cov_4.519713:55-390(+)